MIVDGVTTFADPSHPFATLCLAVLAAQWRRYQDAQVYLFDKGRSARAIVLGLGGDFFDFFAINDTAAGVITRVAVYLQTSELHPRPAG